MRANQFATGRKAGGLNNRKVLNMSSPQTDSPIPTALTVHTQSRMLEVSFSDGAAFNISFELMRVYSPSAEVQGHGPGQEVLQTGKQDVLVTDLSLVGNYAVKPVFDDGHDTGLFTWQYLYKLGAEQNQLWAGYERRLVAAGKSRSASMDAASASHCGGA